MIQSNGLAEIAFREGIEVAKKCSNISEKGNKILGIYKK